MLTLLITRPAGGLNCNNSVSGKIDTDGAELIYTLRGSMSLPQPLLRGFMAFCECIENHIHSCRSSGQPAKVEIDANEHSFLESREIWGHEQTETSPCLPCAEQREICQFLTCFPCKAKPLAHDLSQ